MLQFYTFKCNIRAYTVFCVLCFYFLSLRKYDHLNVDYFLWIILQDHCYYHGRIDRIEDSSVSVGVCSGMRYGEAITWDMLDIMTQVWSLTFVFSVEVLSGLKSKCIWSNPWVIALKETTPSIGGNTWGGRGVLMETPVSQFTTRNPEQQPSSNAAAGYMFLNLLLTSPGLYYAQKSDCTTTISKAFNHHFRTRRLYLIPRDTWSCFL